MNISRWQKLSFAEQMGNIGSEFLRSKHWKERGDFESYQKSLERAIELTDLTISDRRWQKQRYLSELNRLREVFCDLYLNQNRYEIKSQSLENYFLFFALMSCCKSEAEAK